MARKTHKANSLGASVGNGGLADQMAARTRQDGEVVGGEAINSTSIFDPVLAELLIRWFSAPGMAVLDPFAGGSVRGIVTAMLGRDYVGIDLRAEQVEANWQQADGILVGNTEGGRAAWLSGDSTEVLPFLIKRLEQEVTDQFDVVNGFDFIMTCPPYADLEVYSDDPRDISNMRYDQFFGQFGRIMAHAVAHLKENRFIALVVGDARGKDGAYYGFPAHCVAMMQGHGVKLWNTAILVTPAGSLPARAKLGFTRSRKLGNSHQTVLIFVKGDGKVATEACGECQFGANDPLAQLEANPADPLDGLGTVL